MNLNALATRTVHWPHAYVALARVRNCVPCMVTVHLFTNFRFHLRHNSCISKDRRQNVMCRLDRSLDFNFVSSVSTEANSFESDSFAHTVSSEAIKNEIRLHEARWLGVQMMRKC